MFQGSDYIFAIQTSDFKFWKVVNNKVVVNAQPYFLDYAPAGRDELNVQNVRNRRYWCIDRSVSNTLTFVNDGAQILKYIMLNKGMEESPYLAILEQQLHYEPNPGGTIEYTSGSSPFTQNTTIAGTITGTPGETVYVKMYMLDPNDTWPATDNITGNFDGFTFVYTGYEPTAPTPLPYVIYSLVVPAGGVINFSFLFDVPFPSTVTAGMDLVNSEGNTQGGYKYWYKLRSRAEFDLTTYSHEGTGIKVTTLEESFAKFLKSNEDVTLELPLNVDDAINVKMDGIRLHEKANYADVSGVIFSPAALGGGYDRGLTTTVFLNNEGDHVGITLESQFQSGYPATFPDTVISTNCIMHNFFDVPIELTVAGTSEFECVSQSGTWAFRRRFLLSSSDFPTQDDYEYHDTGTAIDVGSTYTQAYSKTITLPPGERLYTQSIFFGGVSGDPGVMFTDNSRFSISFISRYQATYIKAFRAQYLFEKYVDFVGEGKYSAAVADFFDTHSDKVFTCGNGIRGFEEAVLKWNLSGFFQFWDSFSSVGLSEDNGVIDFAEKQDLSAGPQIDLPAPSEFKMSLDREMLYSTLKIGYPPIKNDVGVLNGNQEFNTGFEFSLGVMKKPAELDKVSLINASCYAIEKIRVTTINKETTDYKADNDVFPLVINNTLIAASGDIPAHYELDRSLNATATGITESDSVFNMALSPHLNLKRNGPWLRSLLWLCDSKNLTFRSADKNDLLEFDDPLYGHIIEKASENIGGLGDKFITPVIFSITIPAPDDLLETDPTATYRFQLKGTYYTGISIKDSTGLASKKAQNWDLLALPDNDFKKLENYYG